MSVLPEVLGMRSEDLPAASADKPVRFVALLCRMGGSLSACTSAFIVLREHPPVPDVRSVLAYCTSGVCRHMLLQGSDVLRACVQLALAGFGAGLTWASAIVRWD